MTIVGSAVIAAIVPKAIDYPTHNKTIPVVAAMPNVVRSAPYTNLSNLTIYSSGISILRLFIIACF